MASRAVLLVLASLSSVGCASVSINDLRLSSVQVVNRDQQSEFPAAGDIRPMLSRMAGDPNLLTDPRLAKIARPVAAGTDGELLFKVEFTTRVDLSKVDYGDNLNNDIFFCHRPDIHVLLRLPYVYSNGHGVPSGFGDKPSQTTDDAGNSTFTYYIFFRVARDDRGTPSKPPLESFDLRQSPEDVCFRLVGGAYRALGYSSNIVVIPKEMIRAALRNFPSAAQ
jgi:hypothetical protein